MSDTTIDDLLNEVLLIWKQDYPKFDRDNVDTNDQRMTEYFERLEIAKQQTKSALYELILEIIGEDEKPQHQPFSEAIDTESNKIIRNELKAEQRTKLTNLMGDM